MHGPSPCSIWRQRQPRRVVLTKFTTSSGGRDAISRANRWQRENRADIASCRTFSRVFPAIRRITRAEATAPRDSEGIYGAAAMPSPWRTRGAGGLPLHGFKQITNDISDARVYGAIHFRFDQDAVPIWGATSRSIFTSTTSPREAFRRRRGRTTMTRRQPHAPSRLRVGCLTSVGRVHWARRLSTAYRIGTGTRETEVKAHSAVSRALKMPGWSAALQLFSRTLLLRQAHAVRRVRLRRRCCVGYHLPANAPRSSPVIVTSWP